MTQEWAKSRPMAPTKPDGTVDHELGWVPTSDEHRRAYVMELYAAEADLDFDKHLEKLQKAVQWLQNGFPDVPKLSRVK